MQQRFRDGKQVGESRSWYENAQLKSVTSYSLVKDPKGHRVESKPDGKWIYYDKNGKVIMETTYKDGVKVN
jgi:antitoxin component YwqK of YwqJK toxin-antitoxin module